MSTFEKIAKILVAQIGVDDTDVTPQATIVDDLGADSLDEVELVMALETEFIIDIPDDEERSRGWNRVIAFLRKYDDEPVVTSFSVTSQFPNPYAGGNPYYRSMSEEESEAFYALPHQERWTRGMDLLKRIPALEWKPETWRTDWARFPTVLDLKEYALNTFPPKDSMYDRWGAKV